MEHGSKRTRIETGRTYTVEVPNEAARGKLSGTLRVEVRAWIRPDLVVGVIEGTEAERRIPVAWFVV